MDWQAEIPAGERVAKILLNIFFQNEKASSNNQDYQKALKMLKMSPRSCIRMQ
jgi:hypothetical protein